MAYLSLYRKYRSQRFEEVCGQEHVTRTLQNALKADRVAHAYLFSGPRGTGKTSTARLLARALNCERGPTAAPCGECTECQEIRDGISPSVIEIDAASSRGIDEVRDLRQRVMTAPSRAGARKIFIVDEVHMLTTEACNALLKTLEEPPAHVLFVLATTDAQKLPATILSRCQRFEFRRGSVGLIGERLKFVAEAEGFGLEPEAVRLLARGSGGSWRDAISLLEQVLSFGGSTVTAAEVAAVLGAVSEEALLELADGLAQGDGRSVYTTVERLISAGTEPRQLARDLGEHFRALLLADAAALPQDAYSADTYRRLVEQAARFGTHRLVAALEALAQAEKEMRWSDTGRVVLEVALARLMMAASDVGRPALSISQPDRAPAASRVADAPDPGRSAAWAPSRAAAELSPDALDRPQPSEGRPAERATGNGAAESGSSLPPAAAPVETAAPAGPTDTGEFDPFEHAELPAAVTSEGAPVDNAATPAVDAGRSTPELEQVRERWNVVLEELKRRRSPQTQALLVEAQPQRCDDNVLVVGFRYSAHRDMWERGDHKQQLATALQSVLGQPFQVRSEVAAEPASGDAIEGRQRSSGNEKGAGPGRRVAPASPAPTPADAGSGAAPETLEGEALLHEVIAAFEGQIVEEDPL